MIISSFLWNLQHRPATLTAPLSDSVASQGVAVYCCCAQLLSCMWLFVSPWVAAHQALLSIEFSRQEYWSEFPFPSPGKLPNPGIEKSLMSLVLAGRLFPTSSTWKPYVCVYMLGTLDMLPGSSRENEAPPEESDQVDCCCLVIKFFHTVHGVLKARMLKWFAISFPSGPCFVSTKTRPSWVALHSMAHSFTELDHAVSQVISLFS